jgi:phytanoyl-CoA hydroxylase
VGYAGAPASREAPGGRTVRRLRGAWQRHQLLQQWAADPELVATLGQLFDQPVVLNLAHHNCVMTKHPDWGTATGWHRDIRYWSFAHADLITVWLALGPENAGNGGLQVLPGSHRWQVAPQQRDALDFLRPDLPQNQALMAQGVTLSLGEGDVLLFHSSLFHAAGANLSGQRKFSVAFAYRGADNLPLAGSRSAAAGEIALDGSTE